MKKNIIMRVAYNRPEMLKLTIDAEIVARSKSQEFLDGYKTLFIVEHGATEMVQELVKTYPFDKEIIFRPQKFGLSKNILEGFKVAFSETDNHVIYLEDDMVVHRSYFEYMKTLMALVPYNSFSVLSAFSLEEGENASVGVVRKQHHYAAWAPLISKYFFDNYVLPNANEGFYTRPAKYVTMLNEKYKHYWKDRLYKYTNAAHHQQAGLINRLVDAAMIDEGMHVFMPEVSRVQHIGFYGSNRAKVKDIPGSTFDERVENLRIITTDVDKMYAYTGSKQYKDYNILSSKLDAWDGTLSVV